MKNHVHELIQNLFLENYSEGQSTLDAIIQEKIKERYNRAVLVESVKSRVDEILQSSFFGVLDRKWVEDRFDLYKREGVVPTEKVSLNDTSKSIPLEERDFEEVLPYVFKFVDSGVKSEVTRLLGDDQKKINKLNKHYEGLDLKLVVEDASQIKGTLFDWFAFKNKKTSGVPKSLRTKISFSDLSNKVSEARTKITSGDSGKGGSGSNDPDHNMPDGFEFIKESGNLRLYKWHTLSDVCSLDKSVRRDWLSLTIDVAGEETHEWCVNSQSYAEEYGYNGSSGSGKFDYPYYLVREKRGDRYSPKYLLHGNSRQAKDEKDHPMEEEHAEEVMGGLISPELIQRIYEGTE